MPNLEFKRFTPARKLAAPKRAAKAKSGGTRAGVITTPQPLQPSYEEIYRSSPMERVDIIKAGVPAHLLSSLAKSMNRPKEQLIRELGMARATVDRKIRNNERLGPDEGSRVMGIARLVGQVEDMVRQGGAGAQDFDPARWLARWLDEPLPALNGRRPGEFMDTPDGQAMVAQLLARMVSGAYA